MIEPPSLDGRIVAQAATFTICTDTSKSFESFLADHDLDDALARYVIPHEHVPHVRDQLDLAGVDERRLFPDLSGVAASVRRSEERRVGKEGRCGGERGRGETSDKP